MCTGSVVYVYWECGLYVLECGLCLLGERLVYIGTVVYMYWEYGQCILRVWSMCSGCVINVYVCIGNGLCILIVWYVYW